MGQTPIQCYWMMLTVFTITTSIFCNVFTLQMLIVDALTLMMPLSIAVSCMTSIIAKFLAL